MAGPGGAGRGQAVVTSRRGVARARVGKRCGPGRRSLEAASCTEWRVAGPRSALPVMSLRSNLSRLLRTQVHSVLKKSIHSVAVIGAPFSRGQVRTGTWHGGTGSPPPEPGESRRRGRGEVRRGWGEAERGWGGGFRRLGTGRARGTFPPSKIGRLGRDGRHPVCDAGRGSELSGFCSLPRRSEKLLGLTWGDRGEGREEMISWRGWRRNRSEFPVENQGRGD